MLRAAHAGGAAVVIGGGLLGLEAATGLAARGMAVTVVHAMGWPMERQLDRAAGGLLARRLGLRGIRFAMPGATIGIEGHDRATGVRLADGTVVPARLVVMAVGVRPEASLARAAGLAVERGIVVDDAMRTSDPAIHAVGECTEHRGRTIGLVAPALEQAEVAARAIAGEAACWSPRADAAALKVSGTAAWSAGEIAAEDADSIVLHDEAEESYRRLLLRDGRLIGAVLYGDTADAGYYLDLIATRTAVAPFRAALAFGPTFTQEAA
jgi:nitrite reductase (NADH) large subunit